MDLAAGPSADHGSQILLTPHDWHGEGENPAEESRRGGPRISHACEPCRKRKIKCDGARPICGRCRERQLDCIYGIGKRDDLKVIRAKVARYETLLEELLPRQDAPTRQAIRDAVTETSGGENESASGQSPETAPNESRDSDEWSVGASAGSSTRDTIPAQPARARSSRFLGKSSVISWMEDLGEKVTMLTPSVNARDPFYAQHRAAIESMNNSTNPRDFHQLLLEAATYHVNEIDHSELAHFSEQVDPFELPPRPIADALVESFFTTMYPLFPIVLGSVFMKQYQAFWLSLYSDSPENGLIWRAIMNLIFALGAIHAHLIEAEWEGNEKDHIQYFIRARLLSLDPLPLIELPEVEHVQLTALTGMYLVSSFQINRAWHIIGLSIRHAQSRALHLHNDLPGTTPAQQELEARVWHSLCSLERLLCFLTGRPTAIQQIQITARIPTQIEDQVALELLTPPDPPDGEAQTGSPSMTSTDLSTVPPFALAASMLPFSASLNLDKLIADALSQLYSPDTALLSWTSIQALVTQLNSRLEKWRADLPPSLSLDGDAGSDDKAPFTERMYLALRYLSTSMTINRPHLCEPKTKRPGSAKSESKYSRGIDNASSRRCISSARHLVSLFPEDPDVPGMYNSTPWWSVLHAIVQAMVVLIFEISFGCRHVPEETDNIISDAGKVLRWLKAMSKSSAAAWRSWMAVSRLLLLALSKNGRTTEGLAADMPADISLPMKGLDEPLAQNAPADNPQPAFGAQPPAETAAPYEFPSIIRSPANQFFWYPPILTPYDVWAQGDDPTMLEATQIGIGETQQGLSGEGQSTIFGSMFRDEAQTVDMNMG